jgi:hypothetical protein
MKTQAEHLPNEVWLLIFSYLEAHDLFNGFVLLNHRFKKLLTSAYLTFYLELKQQNNYDNQYDATTRWLDTILKRIVCLQLTAQHGYEDILKYLHIHADKLIQLQSLTIIMNKGQTYIICQILQNLRSFKYLSVICKKTSILISIILSLPTLRLLQLTFKKSIWCNVYPLNVNNNIETFYINFQDVSDYSLANLLLDKMPNLKRFELSGDKYNYFNPEKLFAQPVFNLTKLRTIKLVGGAEYFLSISLNHFQTTMPSLKRLYMDISCLILDEKLFDHLFDCWWPILIKLENIYIIIKGYISSYFSTKADNYWKMLLAKNKELNNGFRIEWKSYRGILTLIKLIIIKNKK